MDSASFQFVLFGLAVAVVSNFSRSPVWRSTVLAVASILFLALLSRSPVAFVPLAGFLLLGYGALVLLERGISRSLVFSVLAVVAAYVWLKKYTFLPEGIFLAFPFFTLGLSYIFFRVLHLLIETGDGSEKRHVPFFAYLLYTLNFTTLVAGPIQRYDDFARDQLAPHPITLSPGQIGLQMERLVRGFFKVNVLAMLLHAVQEDGIAQLSQPVPMGAKLAAAFRLAVVYPLFLYANFSGYIDVVIALARLMRVRLPENFDRPFSASSVIEFWTRWHMTLSNWFKVYVYNPLLLALMRRVSSRAVQPFLGVLCFFVTFFLIGIWHGRTSEFVVFGVLNGAGISINKLWELAMTRALGRKGYLALAKNSAYLSLGRGLNFTWFAYTMFWFWGSWKQIDRIFASLGVLQWLEVWTAIWVSATAVLALWEWLRGLLLSIRISSGPVVTSGYARVVYASAMGVIAFIITVLLNQAAPGIVYKAF